MPDTTPFDRDHPVVDPERKAPKNAFDTSDHYSGQDYDLKRERAQAREHPEGEVDPAMRPGAGTEPGPTTRRPRPDDALRSIPGPGKCTGPGQVPGAAMKARITIRIARAVAAILTPVRPADRSNATRHSAADRVECRHVGISTLRSTKDDYSQNQTLCQIVACHDSLLAMNQFASMGV